MKKKKYNPLKLRQAKVLDLQKSAVKDIAVVHVFGDKQTYVWHRPSRQLLIPKELVVKSLFQHPYPWNVGCVIACRPPHGKPWYRIWDVGPEHPAHHIRIQKGCQEKHIELLHTTPKHQRLNGCWVATTDGSILERDEYDDILDAVDMWGFISPFEDEQRKEQPCTSDA